MALVGFNGLQWYEMPINSNHAYSWSCLHLLVWLKSLRQSDQASAPIWGTQIIHISIHVYNWMQYVYTYTYTYPLMYIYIHIYKSNICIHIDAPYKSINYYYGFWILKPRQDHCPHSAGTLTPLQYGLTVNLITKQVNSEAVYEGHSRSIGWTGNY